MWCALSDLLGRRRDELPFYDPPAHGWRRFHERLDRHEAFRDIEFRIQARHGDNPIWLSISGRPRVDSRGEFVGYEGVGRDVTDALAPRLNGAPDAIDRWLDRLVMYAEAMVAAEMQRRRSSG